MITAENGQFVLDTDHTTYCFSLLPSGHLEHLYYGPRIDLSGAGEILSRKCAMLGGNGIAFSGEYPLVNLEDLCMEMSSLGHGDLRDPFLELEYADGNRVSNFLFRGCEVSEGKREMKTLPSSYGAEQELRLFLEDAHYGVELELVYAVYPSCDVITRRAVLHSRRGEPVTIRRLMSLQLDLDDPEYVFHTFTGAWAREMTHQEIRLCQGHFVNESRSGISSSMNNPFVMLSRPQAAETAGDVYGFNLVYSGSHYESAEVNAYGRTRITAGIQPAGFAWELAPGEFFESPEVVMSFSSGGFGGLSRSMHRFVREHIVRGKWKSKERPVLLNSWEAVYFDFDEEKLLALAERAKDAGVELFVMDDGWFGSRNDDSGSLGDWQVNTEKLPGGIAGLAEKIRAMGLMFGLWVEPEMICVKSRLYEEHPDWAVDVPGTLHSEGRNQRILDLTRGDVRKWLVETMSEVFSQRGVSYVKWDNNRIFTDLFSRKLSRQTEFLHRYYLGCYEVMGELVRRFPDILFEGCASGGNRFDLGILCYMPQIWASDDTDAVCRAAIQSGLSFGYPMSVVSAHVSACPNHQTGRVTPLETRFGVAAFGVLGYECSLAELTEEEMAEVKAQIAFYKRYRRTLQYGDFCRLAVNRTTDYESGVYQWITVAPDQREALGFYLQVQTVPNTSFGKFTARGLAEDGIYTFADWQARTGEGGEENWSASGSLLNHAGVKLTQACSFRGNRPGTRYFTDGSSRIYVMEKIG